MNDVTNLAELSDEELKQIVFELQTKERDLTVKMLECLAEVERRKLYLALGHSSLFSFCLERLGYSESGANRRIRSARAMERFSPVKALLLSGELNLSTLSTAAGVLTEENSGQLLSRISNQSQRDVERILAGFNQRPAPVRESVRPVVIRREAAVQAEGLFSRPSKEIASESLRSQRWLQPTVAATEPVLERRVEFRFSVTEETNQQFRRVQTLLSNRFPKGLTVEKTFEALVSDFLKHRDPAERKKRRGKRKTAKAKPSEKRTRYISPQVKDVVFERDGGRCAYVAPDGHRCNSTRNLEFDHIHPFVTGGTNEPENLRLLCRVHNQYAGVLAFGPVVMRRRKLVQTERQT